MKQLIPLLFLLAVIGCASPERNAYIAIGSVDTTANAAIASYGDYIHTHSVSDDQLQKVRQAVLAYKRANETANAAITAYKSSAADQTTLDKALAAVTASSAQVVALINSITQPE